MTPTPALDDARWLEPPQADDELRALLLAHTPHVWSLSPPLALPGDEALLDDDERERAARFHFDRDRTLFVAAHAACRLILARYLLRAPEAIELVLGAHGKPALVDGGGLRFNLAHTGGLVLVAVAREVEVGVDCERVTSIDDGVIETAMAVEERAALRAIADGEARRRAFFATWARREAILKALGVGLSLPVEELAVEVGSAARIVRGAAQLTLVDLPVGESWSAALAIEGRRCEPRLYRFSA